jgi:hypothetical protein
MLPGNPKGYQSTTPLEGTHKLASKVGIVSRSQKDS